MCQTRRPVGHVQPGIHFWQSEMWRQYILTCCLFAVETDSPCEKEALTHRSYPFLLWWQLMSRIKEIRKNASTQYYFFFCLALLSRWFNMPCRAVTLAHMGCKLSESIGGDGWGLSGPFGQNKWECRKKDGSTMDVNACQQTIVTPTKTASGCKNKCKPYRKRALILQESLKTK